MNAVDTIGQIKHLNAEVTRGCNLRCGYCFNNSGKRLPHELSTDRWREVIDVIRSHGAQSALFTGGEVMTREDTPEILDYSLNRGLETSVLSNGYHVTQTSKELIGKLRRVQISLDRASPLTHDMRRGEGSWRIAREAIDYIRSCNAPVEISTTISLQQLDELEGTVGIAYATGSKVLVRPLQNIGRASTFGKTDFPHELSQKQEYLHKAFGDIFVEDFARYVPVRGGNHDLSVLAEGYITILPDGIIRGLNKNILQLALAV